MTKFDKTLLIIVLVALFLDGGQHYRSAVNRAQLSAADARYDRLTVARGRLQGFLAQKLREKGLSESDAAKLEELEREAEVPGIDEGK